ncbi:MAG: NAD-dependent epimerase/dehydratase family protein [Chloroflexi bacterium]|nr:NAD-dependent epimerase/dehydratase family protein [Chloroflexota bacterium]
MRVLVTGGAGFIGRSLVKALSDNGHSVIVLDSLLPQVHGERAVCPDFAGDTQVIRGDIRDGRLMGDILGGGIDIVYHLAAMTGVGQSMYQMEEYVDINCRGTATLMDAIVTSRKRPRKIILSSSRAVYGEGHLQCACCGFEFYPMSRSEERLHCHQWEHACPRCGADSLPLPSLETSPRQPTSVYGLTKQVQEQILELASYAYDIPVVVLRYFNVYGPGQSPTNPYTGILSIFSRRLMNGLGVEIYEDGHESRDFVFIDDVVQANLLACEQSVSGAFNICSGEATSVYEVALMLAGLLGYPADVLTISSKYRVGDIRHGIGSRQTAGSALGYYPRVPLSAGLEKLVMWMLAQKLDAVDDPDHRAEDELRSRGLLRCGLKPQMEDR